MTSSHLLHRTGSVTVTVLDPGGRTLPDTTVLVEQVGHSFGFGNIAFDLVTWLNQVDSGQHNEFGGARATDGEHISAHWLELYNHATLPFYWRTFESERGQPDTQRMMTTATWLKERGVTVKGHPLLWHTLAPQWLMDVPLDERDQVIRERITREVTDFAGLIDQWDAINETVILPVFTAEDNAVTPLAQARGRMHVIRLAFDTAREAAQAAGTTIRLTLNDFDLSEDYEAVIEECLEAGVAIDALGLQTHMHQGFRGEDNINEILARFARFGLPIQMTETTLVSGHLMPAHIVDLNDYQIPAWPSTPEGEERQADEMVRHYTTALAHPLVESLTYWGITDAGSWLGAPCGLLRTDGTPKPSFAAMKNLIKDEWWLSPAQHTTDDAGAVVISGWGGQYRVSAGGASGMFPIVPGEGTAVTVTVS